MIWLYIRIVYLKAVHCIKVSFDSSVFKFLLLSLHIWCDLLLIFFLESFYTLLYWIFSDLVFLRFRYFKALFYDALKLSLLIDDLKFKAHHHVFLFFGLFSFCYHAVGCENPKWKITANFFDQQSWECR